MSRAYCLTCNQQVTMTASGTCPDGHAVSSGADGPEPWIGRAADTASDGEPAMADVDVAELQELQVVGASANGNGHAGAANGHARHGHADGTGHTDVEHPPAPPEAAPAPVERQRANSQASDDLAAMLAEALQSEDTDAARPAEPAAPAPAEPAAPAPAEPAPSEPAPAEPAAVDSGPSAPTPPAGTDPATDDAQEWDDLASLAAELQLDTSLPSDAQAEADVPEPPVDAAPAATEPTWPSDVADEPEDVLPSPAPETEDPPADEVEQAPAASVDLTNFTARGARVGGVGGGKPSRRLFGRKR